MFSMAMWMATLVAPIQILAGDQHGLNRWSISRQDHGDGRPFREPQERAPLILFASRSSRGQGQIRVEIPKVGSLILKHSPGRARWPALTPCRARTGRRCDHILGFRIMVGMGF